MIDDTTKELTVQNIPLFSNEELSNLRVIKLVNGEELIAVVLGATETHFLIRRPCLIVRMPQTDGNVVIILIKWQAFSNEEKHALRETAVIAYSKITDSMKGFYINTVLNQIKEEEKAINKPIDNFTWPDWMDKLDPTKIN